MRQRRKRIISGLSGLGPAAGPGRVCPTAAVPSIAGVTSTVETLYREAEVAAQRRHDATIELAGMRADTASPVFSMPFSGAVRPG